MSSDYQYYGSDWPDVRETVIEDYGQACLLCQEDEDLHVHHIRPLSEFDHPDDANTEDNLVPLCQRCHGRVEHIQNPHTRRTVEHFTAELEAEGWGGLSEVIDHITHKELKTNKLEPCPECFYPRRGEPTCYDCGHHFQPGYGFEDAWGGQETERWVCLTCGQRDAMKEHETVNSHGCVEEGGYHHSWVRVGEVVWKCQHCGDVDPVDVFCDYPAPHGCPESENGVHDYTRTKGG